MKKILLLFLIIASMFKLSAKTFLFNKGKSDFCIVIPETASTSEKTAANELQSYLRQISGVTLDVCNSVPAKGNYIYIGYNKLTNTVKPVATSEAYTYKTINGNLFIWGGADRGTMYGVFSFLENVLGVKWYAPDCTKIPKLATFELTALNHTEKPCIKKRLDFYNAPLSDAVWCAHNKMNEQGAITKNNYGNTSAYNGVHTLLKLVPTETYFSSHPEYYSERHGKRQRENCQLCLTNKDVLAIVKTNTLKTIKENPDYWVYDVSQDDNQNYCQCENCMKIANLYGGQSGLMLWFVNQVADAVENVYPSKMIGTFAYQYTRHAPKDIKPRSNVVIRLCDIECCFDHPLASSTCAKNMEFMNDLQAWGKITQNIYIWDYVVNFHNYLVPFPDFTVLASNIQTFAENHAIGILEEGAYDAKWAEFSELRAWIIAKLLWNPKQDVNTLAKDFCMGYYGAAANDIYAYYLATQKVAPELHLAYNTSYEKDFYTDDFIDYWISTLEASYNKVKGDATLEKRVDRILAQVYFMYTCRHYNDAKKNGIYKKLKDILTKDPTRVKEGFNDLDAHLKNIGYT